MGKESQQGRKLHAEALQQGETGTFTEALGTMAQAKIAYIEDGDILGLAEAHAMCAIIYRNYAIQHDNDRNALIMAKGEMFTGVQIARESGDQTALALPLYQLAKIQETLSELPEAIASYTEAIQIMQTNPPERHNRPAVLADMKVALATCEYRAGDSSALERAQEFLNELEQTDEPNPYNKDVWVSGGCMRIAEILRIADPIQARYYLDKARAIIDNNQDLKLRKEQWEKLATLFD